MSMISTRKLTRRYGRTCAVNSLDLDIEAGEIFGLVGRNGAGKTTVIKMLTTLLPRAPVRQPWQVTTWHRRPIQSGALLATCRRRCRPTAS